MKSFLYSGEILRKAVLAAALVLVVHPAAAQNVNEDAAETLAKAGHCFKCHSVEKAKKAPSYKRIAQKYKGKPDAEAVLIKHLSGSKSVTVEGGGDEQHEPPPAKDAADLKNLVHWILSRG
ncbi:c-type cytochrome [Sulfuritalea sp.]|uniref:c-type cytochrome n=1 Tax=Sulfuritalea sp. TaxID=2480090 RepID=UPI00286DCCC8|nr:c-type cytochrome [Sulfuritalea sp.]